MLLIFGGLPGTGKSTLSQKIARQLQAVHIRIDSIEQTLRDAGKDVTIEGYAVGYQVTADNLALGHTVVADSVNPLPITRNAWRAVGAQANVRTLEIEVICSDAREHQRRIEQRTSDIPGLKLPSWQDVLERDYEDWIPAPIRIDTAGVAVDVCQQRIVQAITEHQATPLC